MFNWPEIADEVGGGVTSLAVLAKLNPFVLLCVLLFLPCAHLS